MNNKWIAYIFLIVVSVNCMATDFTCPYGLPANVDLWGVEIEYYRATETQTVANVYVSKNFRGLPLSNVDLVHGEWTLNDNGNEKKAPEIISSLKLRTHNNQLMTQIFLGESGKKTSLIIQYGKDCGFFMSSQLNPRAHSGTPTK